MLICALVGFAAVGAHAALAAAQPSAATGGTQSVSASSATLTGTVNPQGQDTTYAFQYGPTTAYGTQTPSNSAGNGTTDVSASATIGSLAPATTYHYRIVATNASGTSHGADATFTTATRAPAATTGAAKSVSATSATLTGSVNPEGQDTTYEFRYGVTTAYGTQTSTTGAGNGTAGVSVSATIGSLSPSTTYHYRIVATNASGTTFGADKTLTTPAAPAPTVATAAATSITATSATLTGSVNPHGQPTTYRFEYGPTTAYGTRTPASSAGNASAKLNVFASIGSLTPHTTYHYRIVATNASGNGFGADRTFTTARVSPEPPAVATGGVKAFTATSATLTGTVNPHGAATKCYFQYGSTTAYGGRTSTASAGSGKQGVSVEATIKSLSPGTTYHYRIVATNAGGTSFGADRTFTSARPSRVSLAASPGTVVVGQAATLTGIVLGPGPLRTRVTLQRASRPGGPFFSILTTASSSKGTFRFGPLTPSKTTYFRAITGGVASAPVVVRVRFRVTLFVSATRPLPGKLVRFHGTVVPPHNGRRVLLQRLGRAGRWHTIRMPRLHPARGNVSRYAVSIRVHRNGLWRVIARPDADHAKGFSRVVRIRLLRS